MRDSAVNYSLKDRLAHLGQAASHALVKKRLRAERRQAEERLRPSERRFRALIENFPDGIALISADSTLTYVSPSCRRILGYAEGELIGQNALELVHPDEREYVQRALTELFQTPSAMVRVEYRARHKDGAWIWIESIGTNLLAEPSVQAVVSNYRDITERKRAEGALRALSRAVEQTADHVFITDRNGVIEYVNAAFEKSSGYTKEEVLGKTPRILKSGRHPAEFSEKLWQTILAGRVFRAEFINQKKNRELYYEEKSITPIRDAQGNITHFVSTGKDITERKRAEETIRHQVEQITALRTIDTAINANLDLRATLNVILDQVTTQLRVNAAVVLLLDQHTQTLEYAAGRGFTTGALQYTHLRLGEGHAGRVALESRTIGIPNLITEPGDFTHSQQLAREGFVAYYGVPLTAKGQVKGVLELFHRTPLNPDPEWLDFMHTLAAQAAIAIHNMSLLDNLQRSNAELTQAYDATIQGWSRALDLRDRGTEGHTQRVTELTLRLARARGVDKQELVHIRRGAVLHDIGKMGIPDSILLKPGPLTPQEWELMRKHPVYAYEMLSPITFLKKALDIPYCHHEKWDGSGYPRGLKGEEIPLTARIFAVVDVWDALRSDRPYGPAVPEEEVIERIRALAGTHFDPQVAEAFLRMISEE